MSSPPSISQPAAQTQVPRSHRGLPYTGRLSIDWDAARVCFEDWDYTFEDRSLLEEAFTFRGSDEERAVNRRLAIAGDKEYGAILCRKWCKDKYRAGKSSVLTVRAIKSACNCISEIAMLTAALETWSYYFHRGLAMNSFLAAQARRNGLREVMLACLPTDEVSLDELATTMEALIGAVADDSEWDPLKTEDLMRRLGIYWPTGEAEWLDLDVWFKHLADTQEIIHPDWEYRN